ncbi:MAG: autotransporter-associated beta strand repeat-containing protein, partial [Verrucomicrobiota bacterium]
ADLNGSTPAGSTTYSNGVWTVKGGYNGGDVWNGGADTFRFAYKQLTGDFTMIAKLTSLVGSSSARAGIMVRDSLGTATNECWGAFLPTPVFQRAVFNWSAMTYGANMQYQTIGLPQTPYWVKIERIGPLLEIFDSPNGADWSPTAVADFNMPNTMYVGLFVNSGVTGTAATATFSNVRITSGDGWEAAKVPLAPFAIYAGPGDGQVQLRWNEAFGAANYKVKRSYASGGPYTTIATVPTTTYTDSNALNGVTYYYVVTAANAAGESGNSLEDNTTPQLAMVSVVSGGGATASANTSGGEGAAQAFDINPNSDWFNNNAGTTGWLQYDLGPFVRQTVQRYAITSPNGSDLCTPSAWQFLGSLDGANWTVLDTQTNQAFPMTYPMKTYYYDIANSMAYRFYRLNISANNGDPSGLRVAELALLALPGTGINLGTTAQVWSGAVSGNWNTTTANWQSNGVSGTYQNGNAVLFDDTAAANTTINVASVVTPSSVIFNNAGNNYTFSGSAIGGATNVQKVGGGTVTLNNANTFPGGISIFAGTVNVGNNAALGTGTVTLNGGTLQNSAGLTGVTNPIAIGSGGGTITLGQANNITFTGPLSGSGNLTIAPPVGYLASLYLSFSTNTASGTITIPNSSGNNQIVTRFGAATAGSAAAAWSIGGAGDRGTTFDFGAGTISFGSLSGSGLIQGNSSGTHTMSVGALNANSTFSGTIKDTTGNVALTKVGTGTLRLTGANTYSGQTTVSNGELVVSTAFASSGNFVVNAGATLGVTNDSSASATIGNLTNAAGSALEFQNVSSTTTPLVAAANVTFNGACTVNITGPSGLAVGVYPLVSYSSKFTGAFANLQLQLPSGFGGVLASNANHIALSVTNVPAPSAPATLAATAGNAQVGLSWSAATYARGYWIQRSLTSGIGYALVGSAAGTTFTDTTVTNNQTYYYVVTATNISGISGVSPEASATPRQVFVWSGAVSANWNFATTNWANAGVYSNGVTVQFDDTVLSNTAVAISSTVTPVLTVVNNTTNSYSFSGSALAGTGPLLKTGSGTLTLGSANTYSGGTIINNGTVQIGSGSASSENTNALGSGLVTVNAGGLAKFVPGSTPTVYKFNNSFAVNGGTLWGDDGVQHLGTGAGAKINIGSAGATINSLWAAKDVYLDGQLTGSGAITIEDSNAGKSYSGGIIYVTGSSNTYNGTVTIAGAGYLGLGTSNAFASATIVNNSGGNSSGSLTTASGLIFYNGTANVTAASLGALAGSGNLILQAGTAGNGSAVSLTIGGLNTNSTYSGGISGSGSITKTGTGTLGLTGWNTYTGPTTVSNGELVVSTLHVGGGNFTVAGGATLGVVNNSFTTAAFGNLTLAANSALEFQQVWNTLNPVASATNVTVGSGVTVKITGTGGPVNGTSYVLINYAGTLSGFTNLQLQMPYGWRGTLTTNATKQILLANVATVATTPTQLNVGGNTGGQLQLSWPNDHTGWRLLMSTNLINPSWTDVSSNLVTATNQFNVPVTGTNGSVFYRLVYP